MTIPALLLILVSALIHAGWNLLGKRSGATLPFFIAAIALGVLLFSPALALNTRPLAAFSPPVWGLLALTGLFQAAYYLALGAAYQTGEISLTYPLARSLPVILVALFSLLFGKALHWLALLGILLVSLGGLVLPRRRLSEWRLSEYRNWPVAWAVAAAVCTAGYSLVDDAALRLARQSPVAIPAHEVALAYAILEGLSILLWMLILLGFSERGRQTLRASLRQPLRPALLAGIGMNTAYLLVLIAMGLAQNISYIVAFRQVGIVFGALGGIAFLSEPAHPPKFLGIGLMTAGLILVGIG